MCLVLIVPAIAFGAQLAVEGGHSFPRRGGLRLREGLMARWHCSYLICCGLVFVVRVSRAGGCPGGV